ncbi:MAG: DUF3472 domain-containing protein, partial [Kiritimatiellia bacterium]
LGYRQWGKPAQIFYIEATALRFHRASYMCLLGFSGGYAGVQELANGNHVAIFSVWEPGDPFDFGAHPDAVAEERRTKELYHGEGVRIRRFGGEGTGGQSMMDFPWKLGEPVRMAVACEPDGKFRTAYTCWLWKEGAWFRMATFSTLVGGERATLRGPYSFLEDFLRNVKSKEAVRAAQFSRLWAFSEGAWHDAKCAKFTADANTLTTIDAGPAADGFWLATGGGTTNRTVKLWGEVQPGGAMDDSAPYRAKLLEAMRAVKK